MKYILKHITQLSLLTVILLSVGALCMWLPSFWHTEDYVSVAVSMSLTLVNTLGVIYVCYHGNLTRTINLFPALPFLFSMGALQPWHSDWRSQIVIMAILVVLLIYQTIDKHLFQSAAEQMFLVTLVLGIASYWLPTIVFAIIAVVLMLLYRNTFDFKSIFAILIGIVVVAIYASIACVLGWIEPVWIDGFFDASLSLRWIPVLALTITLVIDVICYSGEAIWRGVCMLVYVILCLVGFLIQVLL